MANEGVITIKDIITQDALTWGDKYVENVDKAITQNGKLIESAKDLKKLYLELNKGGGAGDLVKAQNKAVKASAKAADNYADRVKAQIEVDKERRKQLSNLLTVENRLQNVNSKTNVQLTEKRALLRQEQRVISKNLTYMGQLEQKRYVALKQVEDLNAKRALGIRLSGQEEAALRKATSEFKQYNSEFQKIKKDTKQFGFNVGNYPKGIEAIGGAVKSLLPGVGLLAGLKFGVDFVKDARVIAQEAKGIEFAFKRLGDEGVDAFDRVKAATRGTLSDLDIKTALVDFDNFNISLEETDTLFEFLAVRAAQTGKSVEYLQSSLVEGLSKESKLRIDNLGISALELNKELEKTPNFVQAVANIAKKEVAEAGDILENAGTSQARWNAELQNFQLYVGNGAISKIGDAMYDFGSNILRAVNPTKELTSATLQQQAGLNTLVGELLRTNEKSEERAILMERISEEYPFFLKFLGDEEATNKDLSKALTTVNGLYIKRLALQRVIEKLDVAGKNRKLADETGDLAKVTADYQTVLTNVNQYINKGVTDTDILSLSLEKQNETLKSNINAQIVRLSQLKGQGQATEGQVKNLARYEKALNTLAQATGVFSNANSQFGFAQTAVNDVTKEVEELEAQLGLTNNEMDDIFNNDNEVVITVKLDPKAREKAIKDAQDAKYKLNKAILEGEIQNKKALLDEEQNDISNRVTLNMQYFDAKLALLELEKKRSIQTSGGTKTELAAIEAEYNNNYLALTQERENSAAEILNTSFEQQKARIEAINALQESETAEKIAPLTEQLNTDLADDSISNEGKLEKVKAYEEAVTQIKREAALERVQIQINQVHDELESEYLSFEQRVSLEQQLTALKTTESQLRLNNAIADIEEEKKAEEALQKFKAEQIAIASGVIAEALDIDAANVERLITGIVEGFDSAIEGIQAAFAVAGDIVNSIFDSNIENIDRQIEKSEEEYERQTELAEGNKRLQEQIQKEQTAKRLELEAKKRKEQEKQAKFNKALAIVDIGIATAVAIIQAFAQLGPIGGAIAAAIIAALGIAQIAVVASKPIPKYAKGTENHPGGDALVGEQRAEWVIEPGKEPYRINQPTVLNLARGAQVVRSDADYRQRLERAAMLSSLQMQGQNLNNYEAAQVFEKNHSYELLLETQAMRKELARANKKPTPRPGPGMDIPHELFRNNQINWD